MMEYDNSPPCSSRFFKNGVDATATAAVGSANSSASVAGLSREADDVDDAMAAVAVGSANLTLHLQLCQLIVKREERRW